MDYLFRRWVRLPTVLALLKPKRGRIVFIRLFTEDDATKEHYPWLEKMVTFQLNGYAYDTDNSASNKDLAKVAENLVAKTITIDRWCLNDVNDCYLIEVKENK